ncbi:hypothetical protein GYMLUDRAFT_68127 [Collybiopsis luxurians FD-317 M1]|nr:hypothetical protein GYMLUDRAFT_68127 [Collybiopsis luxurians FD-317 M1]
MQITLFGATGPSGKALIQEALRRGYTIVVFARSPHKLEAELRNSDRVNIVQGTLDSYPSILSSLQNSVAALVLLSSADGFPRWAGGSSSPLTVTKGYRNIIRAMSELRIKRLIGIGGPSHVEALDSFNLGLVLGVSVLRLVYPKVYEDTVETAKLLKTLNEGKGRLGASGDEESAGDNVDIDWTWIRAPLLYDGPGRGQYNLGYVGQGGWLSVPTLSRDELAKAMLDEIDQRKWIKGIPFCWG